MELQNDITAFAIIFCVLFISGALGIYFNDKHTREIEAIRQNDCLTALNNATHNKLDLIRAVCVEDLADK